MPSGDLLRCTQVLFCFYGTANFPIVIAIICQVDASEKVHKVMVRDRGKLVTEQKHLRGYYTHVVFLQTFIL